MTLLESPDERRGTAETTSRCNLRDGVFPLAQKRFGTIQSHGAEKGEKGLSSELPKQTRDMVGMQPQDSGEALAGEGFPEMDLHMAD